MSKINAVNFYYGAVLSMLFNRNITPAIVSAEKIQ